MIEPLKDFPLGVLAFACHGNVTKTDYDTVLVPMVRDALKARGKLRLYYEAGCGFLRNRAGRGLGRFQGRHGASHALGTHGARHRRRLDQAHGAVFRLSDAGRDADISTLRSRAGACLGRGANERAIELVDRRPRGTGPFALLGCFSVHCKCRRKFQSISASKSAPSKPCSRDFSRSPAWIAAPSSLPAHRRC